MAWNEQANLPLRQRPQQLRVAMEERPKVERDILGDEIDEDVPPPVAGHADGQLVREVAGGLRPAAGEGQRRQFLASKCRRAGEVLDLLALAGEPVQVPVREDVVEDHQALDGPGHRRRLAESCVGLADGRVELLVVQVIDMRLTRPATVRGGVAPGDQAAEEVVRLLAADDAGVGAGTAGRGRRPHVA